MSYADLLTIVVIALPGLIAVLVGVLTKYKLIDRKSAPSVVVLIAALAGLFIWSIFRDQNPLFVVLAVMSGLGAGTLHGATKQARMRFQKFLNYEPDG